MVRQLHSFLLVLCSCSLICPSSSLVQKPYLFREVLQTESSSGTSRRRKLSRNGASIDDQSNVGIKTSKRLKVLCLHGYLSSSKYFQLQLRRLVDDAADISDFVFLDGPHRFGLLSAQKIPDLERLDGPERQPAEISKIPAGKFRWWYASENKKGTEGYEEAVQYTGLRESLISIANTEKNYGPFDVVLGHSQGACLVVAMDCLRSRPEFLSALLNGEDLDMPETVESVSEECSEKLYLPDALLSIVIGGFVPRDQMFDTLFASIEKDSTMNGLPQKSLHLFSHEDSIVPAEASMQAMYLYDAPRMMIRDGDHDPDDQAVDQVLKSLKNVWAKKFRPPLVLEG